MPFNTLPIFVYYNGESESLREETRSRQTGDSGGNFAQAKCLFTLK